MKVQGKWLTKTTNEEDLKYFFELYDMHPLNVIHEYELDKYIVPTEIKAIIFLEYDGTINQAFYIEPHDVVIVWSEGGCDTIFNTDGIAFMELHRDQQMIDQWAIDKSPYEMNDEDLEDVEFDMSLLPEGITRDQTIFVAQL